MHRRHLHLAAIATVAALLLGACGGDDGDGEAVTTSTTAVTSDDGGSGGDDGASGSGAVGDGTWLMGGQRYAPDVLSCLVTTNADGTTLEVVAQGAIASSGGSYAQLRLVDSPPSIGDASIVIGVDGEEHREELEPSGGTTGEAGDLFWEVDDTGTFFLLGSFPIAGAEIDVDLQLACDQLGVDGSGPSDGGTSAGSGGDDAAGTLTVDGVEVELSGTCSYEPGGGTSTDVASATFTGEADGPYGVIVGVSGDAARNTQMTVSTPDDRIAVRWEPDGSLAQSSADGSYELADARLRIELADGIEVDVECAER